MSGRQKEYTEYSRVTVSELARIFHLQKEFVYRVIREHRVLGLMVGTRRKYKVGEFDAALRERTMQDNAVLVKIFAKSG